MRTRKEWFYDPICKSLKDVRQIKGFQQEKEAMAYFQGLDLCELKMESECEFDSCVRNFKEDTLFTI